MAGTYPSHCWEAGRCSQLFGVMVRDMSLKLQYRYWQLLLGVGCRCWSQQLHGLVGFFKILSLGLFEIGNVGRQACPLEFDVAILQSCALVKQR